MNNWSVMSAFCTLFGSFGGFQWRKLHTVCLRWGSVYHLLDGFSYLLFDEIGHDLEFFMIEQSKIGWRKRVRFNDIF